MNIMQDREKPPPSKAQVSQASVQSGFPDWVTSDDYYMPDGCLSYGSSHNGGMLFTAYFNRINRLCRSRYSLPVKEVMPPGYSFYDDYLKNTPAIDALANAMSKTICGMAAMENEKMEGGVI